MKKIRTVAIGAVTMAVVTGGIAFTMREASAGANPANVYVLTSPAGPEIVVEAGDGTVNDITVTSGTGGAFTITDTSGELKLIPGTAPGCVLANAHNVGCGPSIKSVRVYLADGNDTYNNQTNVPSVVFGSDGDDELLGGKAADNLHGGAGKDKLYGGFGNDTLEGGPGQDTVFGQAGNDVLTSDDNLDDLWGSSGDDTLTGGRTMHGDDNNDVLYPSLYGEHWGGTEYDIVDFSKWDEPVHVSLDGNQNDGNASADPTDDCGSWLGGCIPDPMNVHGDVEKIIGTDHDDLIIGNNEPDNFDAGKGNDAIDGRGGNDYLDVESGANQRVRGGDGNDDTCVGYGITVRTGCEN